MLVVGAAYLVQGLVGSIGALIISRLAQLGTPLETQAGILASGAVPWVLKFAIALLLDLGPSWPMRARGLILTAVQACAAVCVWGLAQAWVGGQAGAPASMLAVTAGWIALNVCAASQDVIVDALALDTLGDRRPAAATAMGVGMGLGFGLLGPLVVGGRIVAQGMAAGLSLPAAWIAGLALVPAALLWIPGRPIKARDQARDGAQPRERPARDLARLLWIPVVFATLTFASNTTSAIAPEFMFQHLGWDYPSYTKVLLPIAACAGIVGALGWGPVVAKLGPARAAMIASTALGLVWIVFAGAAPQWFDRSVIAILAASESLLYPALLVGLHALALLAAARSPMPTTAFVLAMAALNLPRVLAPLVAPQVLVLGWAGLFAVCGVAQVVAGAGLWPLRGWAREGDA